MKLTNALRDAFINRVMADVPRVDYHQKMRELMQTDVLAQMPAKVAAVYRDPELRPYLWHRQPRISLRHGHIYTGEHYPVLAEFAFSKSVVDKVREFDNLNCAQTDMLDDTRQAIRNAAYGCRTLKTLREALPDLVKYMPTEVEPHRYLPVVTNVMQALKKAGWK